MAMKRRSFLQLACTALSLPMLRAEVSSSSRIFQGDEISKLRYKATKQRVGNRGVPPDDFLDQLVAWGRVAPEELFAPNTNKDVYTSVIQVLGPWEGIQQRRAALLEVMRVLAGLESSWNWEAGRDVMNPNSVTPDTIEAGAWQVSADSIHFGQDLRTLVMQKVGTVDGNDFQRVTKQDHTFAMEYAARLLRITVNHNGPVKRHEIDAWLRRDSVLEFMQFLTKS